MRSDLRAALAFLTVLPIGYPENRLPGYSFAWYPLVGLVLGLFLSLIAILPWPTALISAFVVLLAWVVLTGGLHLDGFGDSCDGLLATVSPARRLEIMQDPRTGAWAVIGLIVFLLGKWTFLTETPALMLIVPPVIGRWAMVWAVWQFPHANTSGLGVYFRTGFGRAQVLTALVLTLLIVAVASWLVDWRLITLLFVPVVTVLGFGTWAAQRLDGGLTGDVYGAIGELSELLGLVLIVLALRG